MRFNQSNTKYLLRFDDICPTMNWRVWSEIEATLVEKGIKPVLAVVPDNQDDVLKVEAPLADFWGRVREWQARGWTIALHGYQHKCLTRNRGMVTSRRKSEFAGLPETDQSEKLRRAVEIFEGERIRPRVWIAPCHSFDAVTVSLLPRVGITMISDGYCRFPFVCRRNMFWVPQQLSYFRPAPPGVWTVCHHHNHWTARQVEDFRGNLDEYGSAVSGWDAVARDWAGRPSRWSSLLCTSPRFSSFLLRCELKLWGWRTRLAQHVQPAMKPSCSAT